MINIDQRTARQLRVSARMIHVKGSLPILGYKIKRGSMHGTDNKMNAGWRVYRSRRRSAWFIGGR